MASQSIRAKFTEELDDLVAQVREDRSILAAILCGSLSHDTVWEKSDIDLILVTIDDRKVEATDRSIYAGGVNVHALLMPRAEFRKTIESAVRNSITDRRPRFAEIGRLEDVRFEVVQLMPIDRSVGGFAVMR